MRYSNKQKLKRLMLNLKKLQLSNIIVYYYRKVVQITYQPHLTPASTQYQSNLKHDKK